MGNQISTLPKTFKNAENLSLLNVRRNPIDGNEMSKLKRSMPETEIIYDR